MSEQTTEETEARISQLDRAIADADRYLAKLRPERVDLKLLLASRRPGMASERMVTACDKCLRACCWHGIFLCDDARYAGTVDKPASELVALGREHPDYFSEEAVRRVENGG